MQYRGGNLGPCVTNIHALHDRLFLDTTCGLGLSLLQCGPESCVRLVILAEYKTLGDSCHLLFNSHLWRDTDKHEWSDPEPRVPRLIPQQLGLHLEDIAAHWLW